jgi:hypothetical protein
MNMFKKYLVFALFLGLTAPVLAISSRVGNADDLGVGIALGQPFGATAKYWLSSSSAIDAFMGYHWNHNFDTHADYLWHSFSSFNVSSGRMPFYFGLGARILGGDDSQLGLRFPLGLSYLFSTQPLEAFAEIAPVFKVAPDIGGDIDGLVGIRLYINYLK